MKSFSHRSCFFATGLLLAVAVLRGAPAVTPASANAATTAPLFAVPKAMDHFDRTRQRIAELLKRRLSPDPLPGILPNPFQLTEEAPTVNSTHTPNSGPPTEQTAVVAKPDAPADFLQPGSDEEILARYIPTLRITGSALLNGRLQLMINQTPYKEGDRIVISSKNPPISFLIIRIAPGELTLGLNEAVQVLKFKN